MTALTIAAVVLAAGWVFVRRWLQTRFIALKEVGHPQYFSAGVAAVCLLTLGSFVHHFTKTTFAAYTQWEQQFIDILPKGDEVKPAVDASSLKAANDNAQHLIDFAESAGWSLLLAALLPWFFNLPILESRRLMKAVMKKVGAYDAIEQIYGHSLDCGVPLAFTLKSGKVYIGYSLATSSLPDVERKWLMVFPVLSGARDDLGKLEIHTNYAETYGDISESSPEDALSLINQFRTVLSFTEVVSIQTFNISVYYDWFIEQADETAHEEVTQQDVPPEVAKDEEPEKDDDWEAVELANPEVWKKGLMPAAPLSDDERLRLSLYRLYYLGVAASLLLLAYHFIAAVVALFVALLFAAASASQEPLDGDTV